jgi:VIT1/CCC1 family predicted Fe2+/Mn2+ transporter
MPENQLIKNDRIQTEARQADWSSLLGRAIDDMTRIVHSEFRLLVAGMKTVLDVEIDRVFAFVATGVMGMLGALCMLATIVLFLHEFLLLAWWVSFGITALVLFGIAIAIQAAVSRRPVPPPIT